MSQSLAIKYRPKTFDDVTEQSEVRIILEQQLESNSIQHCYLFTGGAGTGKTTCARIFANEINHHEGNPVELDAASNNSVDDMRELIQQAQTKSLNSEYKVFIIDECHMITVQGWNAILKLIEEPPAKSIFIFCTTDSQKIPETSRSRLQRYDFRRISQQGIVSRLEYILNCEMADFDNFSDFTFTKDFAGNWKSGDVVRCEKKSEGVLVDCTALIDSAKLLKYGHFNLSIKYDHEALEYIAKIADGGMRDAITLLDKCLAYSSELTLENVVEALGTVDFDIMFKLTDALSDSANKKAMIEIVEDIHNSGKDLKQFIKQYTHFLLDIQKYAIGCDWKYINIPKLSAYEKWLDDSGDYEFEVYQKILSCCMALTSSIKYSANPKLDIETAFILHYEELS